MNRIKKSDEVIVLTGKDKGKRGTVVKVLDNGKVVVENVNMAKCHTKPDPNKGVAGGIVEREMPIEGSNLALFNPVTKKGDKVGIKTLEDGRKVRYFKSTDEVLDI